MQADASDETLAFERFSSYKENFRGGKVAIRTEDGSHEVAILGGWRDIVPRRNPNVPFAFAASASIIAEATPSTKTGIKYTYTKDTRNNALTPFIGELFRASAEYAGFLGDVNVSDVDKETHALVYQDGGHSSDALSSLAVFPQ